MPPRLSKDKLITILRFWKNRKKDKKWAVKAAISANAGIGAVYYYGKDFEQRSLAEICSSEVSSYEQRAKRLAGENPKYSAYLEKRLLLKRKRSDRYAVFLLKRKRRLYGKELTKLLVGNYTGAVGYGGVRALAKKSGIAEKRISKYNCGQFVPDKLMQPKILEALGVPYRSMDDILAQLPNNINIETGKKSIESYLRAVLPDLGL